MRTVNFPSISILIHIYYPGTYKYLIEKLSVFSNFKVQLLVNICLDTPDKDKILEAFKLRFPSTHFIKTANIGKDIGGKLALFQLMKHLQISSDWLLLLHDKMSPQSVYGERWREELYKVFDSRYLEDLSDLMQKEKTGIICSKEFMVKYSRKEKDVTKDPNYELLKEQSERFQIKLKDFVYVGGTIFWIRMKILDQFFENKDVLKLRNELESGNVMDNFSASLAHTWERLFGLINTDQKYKVEGI